MEDIYAPIKECGRFIATERTEGISTTDVILRVIRDFDFYVKRNIKKGCTREELNISEENYNRYLKEMELEKQKDN